jgi:rhombotail lipoprotein
MSLRRLAVVVALLSITSGCTAAFQELWLGRSTRGAGASSSLVEFLYPGGKVPPAYDQAIPHLNLPLRVGLAFVPPNPGVRPEGLSEEHRQRLLETVKERFAGYDFIDEILIVPDAYMRGKGGFENLEQITRLYGLDVMTLVSYDQVGWVGDNWKSVTYWTIVGAYIFEGSEHDVSTFVDAAVFDMKTRKLLFRAPGSSVLSGKARAIDHEQKLRETQAEGFDEAVAEMTERLDTELIRFKARVEAGKAGVKVTNRPGYTGSGGLGLFELALLAAMALVLVARRRRAGA